MYCGGHEELKEVEEIKHRQVLLLGLESAGKTTIVTRLSEQMPPGEAVPGVEPTNGFSVKSLHHEGYQIECWEVGGADHLHKHWWRYKRRTQQGLIYVVDGSDVGQIPKAMKVLEDFLQEHATPSWPILILANKKDLVSDTKEIEELLSTSTEQLKKFVPFGSIKVMSCSAAPAPSPADQGLYDALEWVERSIDYNMGL